MFHSVGLRVPLMPFLSACRVHMCHMMSFLWFTCLSDRYVSPSCLSLHDMQSHRHIRKFHLTISAQHIHIFPLPCPPVPYFPVPLCPGTRTQLSAPHMRSFLIIGTHPTPLYSKFVFFAHYAHFALGTD